MGRKSYGEAMPCLIDMKEVDMTDYQKKKVIDLGFLLVGIILVGLFLRSQLLNPKIIQEDTDQTTPVLSEGQQYILTTPYSEESETGTLGFSDLIGVEFTQDVQYVDIIIKLSELPEVLDTRENMYQFQIYFDVDGDDSEKDDVLVRVQSQTIETPEDWKTLSETFDVTLLQLDGSKEDVLAKGEWSVVDEKLLFRIPYSKKLGIDGKTPVRVTLNHTIQGEVNQDILPNNAK